MWIETPISSSTTHMWAWTLTSALCLAGCGGFMPITEDFTLCYDHVTYCFWPLQALFRFGIGRSYSCIIFCTKALWFCGLFVCFWGVGNLGTEKQKFFFFIFQLLYCRFWVPSYWQLCCTVPQESSEKQLLSFTLSPYWLNLRTRAIFMSCVLLLLLLSWPRWP